MTPTAAVTPKHLLREGTPAQIRAALVPDDRERFDTSLRTALDDVANTLSLNPLWVCLEHWRVVAAHQAGMGHDAWQNMLRRAEQVTRTGRAAPGSRRWGEVKADLGL